VVSVRLHPILSGEIQLRVMNPRRPRRGPAKLPRTLLGSLFRAAHWYPTRTLGFLFGKIMMKHRLVEPSVPEELSARGVAPSEIFRVLVTHLHLDHVSASGQWPQATFVVDRAERAAADRQRGPGPYVKPHLSTIENWRQVDFTGPEAEAFESFSRTVDVFGDGLVRLVSTPGHSPGHLSVLLRLRDRYALILGDAMMSTLELREPVIDGIIVDQDSYIRSGEEARAFMRAHPDTLAIPSHDSMLWARLEPTYE
jgi:N-acyl homoserine lactone hydrolase